MSPDYDLTRRQYGRQAAWYAQSRVHASGDTLDLLAHWARSIAARRILDVATGTGFAAFAQAPVAELVVGADLTEEMLLQARSLATQRGLANVRFVAAAAEALPFGAATFDLVSCRVAAHHFQSVPAFLAEARRVVRPGGLVVVIDTTVPEDPAIAAWQNEVERWRDPSHVENLTPSAWQAAFATAGLTVEEVVFTISGPHEFTDWVTRSGTPPPVVQRLAEQFRSAPPAVRSAFQISETPAGLTFVWPVIALKGRRS